MFGKILSILGLCVIVLCFGGVLLVLRMVGHSPTDAFDTYVVKPVLSSEQRGDVRRVINENGGDSRAKHPVSTPAPTPTTRKPALSKGKGVNQKKK